MSRAATVLRQRRFDPKQLSGLSLYLRSDLGVTLNGANVAAWADQSGAGNHAAQATGANQPLYVANVQNGRPVLRFNGTSHQLALPGVFAPATLNYSVFAVYNPTSTAATNVLLNEGSSSTNTPRKLTLDNAGGNRPRLFVRDGAGVNQGCGPLATSAGSMILFDGGVATSGAVATLTAALNGAAQTPTTQTFGALATDSGRVGDKFSGTEGAWFLGDLCALLVYARALGAGDQARVRAYLNATFAVY